ncbi:hypothetical protein [Eubacterium sp.]|uniref:hypothetical protein n=1 Tax=Eubacterium sp. TaxID=142586 RepID=UPI00258E4503|nr:hypothetical protein [Eubacterium sp.]MCR5367590.1 hypothetical protein [Eubacterium sp.]
MSRKQRILKKRYAIFCEGDTEYNYTEKMRKNQGVTVTENWTTCWKNVIIKRFI